MRAHLPIRRGRHPRLAQPAGGREPTRERASGDEELRAHDADAAEATPSRMTRLKTDRL